MWRFSGGHKNAKIRCVARTTRTTTTTTTTRSTKMRHKDVLQAAVWQEHHTVLCTCAHAPCSWTTPRLTLPYITLMASRVCEALQYVLHRYIYIYIPEYSIMSHDIPLYISQHIPLHPIYIPVYIYICIYNVYFQYIPPVISNDIPWYLFVVWCYLLSYKYFPFYPHKMLLGCASHESDPWFIIHNIIYIYIYLSIYIYIRLYKPWFIPYNPVVIFHSSNLGFLADLLSGARTPKYKPLIKGINLGIGDLLSGSGSFK